MTNKKSVLALAVAVMVLIAMVFSAAYVAREADHTCLGDGCAICHQITQCTKNLNLPAHGTNAAMLMAALTYALYLQASECSGYPQNATLVGLKVKLST